MQDYYTMLITKSLKSTQNNIRIWFLNGSRSIQLKQMCLTRYWPMAGDMYKEILNRYGSELTAFCLTMGRYDIVTIGEAPDDAAAAKVALNVGSAGNVTTETLRAFTEDEYREIVAALPRPGDGPFPVRPVTSRSHGHNNSGRHARTAARR